MIFVKDLNVDESFFNNLTCNYIIIEKNKDIRLFTKYKDTFQESYFLPRLSNKEIERLKDVSLSNNVITLLGKKYFCYQKNATFNNVKIPYFKKLGNVYELISIKHLKLPTEATIKSSIKFYNNIEIEIYNTNLALAVKKLEDDFYSQNSVCAAVITNLAPTQIPKKFFILYSYNSTFILLDVEEAKNKAHQNDGELILEVDEKYMKHVIGRRGKNVVEATKYLKLKHITVKSKAK